MLPETVKTKGCMELNMSFFSNGLTHILRSEGATGWKARILRSFLLIHVWINEYKRAW